MAERLEEEIKGWIEGKEMDDEKNGGVSGGIGGRRRELGRELKGLMEGL